MTNPLSAALIWAKGLMQRERYPQTGQNWRFFGRSPAGVQIDQDVALTLGAVNACVRVICETLGVLPWHLLEQNPDTRQRRRIRGPLDRLVSLAPNPEMSSQTFRETIGHHALLRGNGFAEIVRDASGRPAELWPLPPTGVPRRLPDGELVFEFWIAGERHVLRYTDLFHVKGLGPAGIVGYDVISYMATTVGHGIAVEEFASEYFRNGVVFSTVLTHPKKLSDKAMDRLQSDMEKTYSGRGQRWRFKVLEEAMDVKQLSATAEQAQMIQTKKLAVEDVARWFRVPLHKIGSLEKATLNNVEQLGIEFVQDTMLPWVVRFETEASLKLIPRPQQGTVYSKMKVSALARGDLKSRMDAYRVGRQWGWLTPNMIAEMEDAEPIDAELGGDTLIVPINMQDARAMVYTAEQTLAGNREPNNAALPAPEPGEQLNLLPAPGVQTSARPAMSRSIASACARIIDREARYLGRKFSNGEDLGDALKNQAGFAHQELWPAMRDVADAHGISSESIEASLRRVTARYYQRRLEVWRDGAQRNHKPKPGELEAQLLEDELAGEIQEQVARAQA